jgi:hypothetical protein
MRTSQNRVDPGSRTICRRPCRALLTPAFINGVDPRVGKTGLGLIGGHAYSAPYEDLTLVSN